MTESEIFDAMIDNAWDDHEELLAYRAIGTIERFRELTENERKCEDCAGCTNWKCDCANIRDMAITEFAERMKELINKWIENGVIKMGSIDEIASQMKGEQT